MAKNKTEINATTEVAPLTAETPPGAGQPSQWGNYPTMPTILAASNEPRDPPLVPGHRRARVTPVGTHVAPIVVSVDPKEENPTRAAILAAKAARDIANFGVIPTVEFLDD